MRATGPLCVGIDPHPYLLDSWGLPDDATGLRDFGMRVIDGTTDVAGIVKPQVAFFERHGSAGIAALEHVIAAAREAGLIVIADAKRGDIGTSAEAYGATWLQPGSPLESDAVTVSPFLGTGSLDEVITLARRAGKGVFVLAATSNPEARALQTAVVGSGPRGGMTVAAGIVADVTQWNDDDPAGARTESLTDIGLVLGATVDLDGYGIDRDALAGTPVLAPGFGHQGARLDQVDDLFGSASASVVVSVSRSILDAGPSGIRGAIRDAARRSAVRR